MLIKERSIVMMPTLICQHNGYSGYQNCVTKVHSDASDVKTNLLTHWLPWLPRHSNKMCMAHSV